MEQFDIIGVLKAYALAQIPAWKFTYGFDNFYQSAQTVGQFTPGQLVLIADFQAVPTFKNGRIPLITYTCLLMLGRKFDANGQVVSLDETTDQKYDRRLKDLMQFLSTAIADVSCQNGLEVSVGSMVVEINQFAENLDFASAQNVQFIQGQ